MEITRYQYQDIDQLIETARKLDYQASYLQLTPGKMQANVISGVLNNNTVLIQKRIRHPIEIRGAAAKGYCTFLLRLSNECFRLNGLEPEKGELYFIPPGADIHIVTSNFAEMMSFAVPWSLILDYSPESAQFDKLRSSKTFLFPIDSASKAKLKVCIEARTQTHLDIDLERDLDTLLLECLTQIAIENQPLEEASLFGHREKRKPLICAQDYIAANIDKSILISDLTQHANVSERTLQRLFRQELGLSPSQYILAQRLEAVRRKLTTVPSKTEQITTIALDRGFRHLGRFSRDFRRHFGFLPSEIRQFHQ
ncbi:MAG: helix-turn-helix domain-containing protein [Spirulina sp.]